MKSDRMWSTGEGNGKPLQYSFLENSMNGMKRQNDRILKGELTRLVDARYATGDQWRTPERMESKQKQYPVVDVTGDRKRCIEQSLDSVGEGEGGMIWENGIETSIISYKK